jgi:hypothetical protein
MAWRATASASLFAALSASLASPAAAQQPQTPLELAIKATDLYKFAAFVEWPPTAFAGPSDPAVLCVAGDDPFGPLLDQAVKGQRIGAHPIVVMRLDHVEKGAVCNILFVASSHRQAAADALDKVRGQPVLTVTDAADAADRGMIDFVLKDARVRFRIDPRAAERGGLTISSKLLSLAVKP